MGVHRDLQRPRRWLAGVPAAPRSGARPAWRCCRSRTAAPTGGNARTTMPPPRHRRHPDRGPRLNPGSGSWTGETQRILDEQALGSPPCRCRHRSARRPAGRGPLHGHRHFIDLYGISGSTPDHRRRDREILKVVRSDTKFSDIKQLSSMIGSVASGSSPRPISRPCRLGGTTTAAARRCHRGAQPLQPRPAVRRSRRPVRAIEYTSGPSHLPDSPKRRKPQEAART